MVLHVSLVVLPSQIKVDVLYSKYWMQQQPLVLSSMDNLASSMNYQPPGFINEVTHWPEAKLAKCVISGIKEKKDLSVWRADLESTASTDNLYAALGNKRVIAKNKVPLN